MIPRRRGRTAPMPDCRLRTSPSQHREASSAAQRCRAGLGRSIVRSIVRSLADSHYHSQSLSLSLFVRSFLPSFIRSFLRSFVPSFVRSNVRSFVRSSVVRFLLVGWLVSRHASCCTVLCPENGCCCVNEVCDDFLDQCGLWKTEGIAKSNAMPDASRPRCRGTTRNTGGWICWVVRCMCG